MISMFVTICNSTTKIQKISEITNFFKYYFLSRTQVEVHHSIRDALAINAVAFGKSSFCSVADHIVISYSLFWRKVSINIWNKQGNERKTYLLLSRLHYIRKTFIIFVAESL